MAQLSIQKWDKFGLGLQCPFYIFPHFFSKILKISTFCIATNMEKYWKCHGIKWMDKLGCKWMIGLWFKCFIGLGMPNLKLCCMFLVGTTPTAAYAWEGVELRWFQLDCYAVVGNNSLIFTFQPTRLYSFFFYSLLEPAVGDSVFCILINIPWWVLQVWTHWTRVQASQTKIWSLSCSYMVRLLMVSLMRP